MEIKKVDISDLYKINGKSTLEALYNVDYLDHGHVGPLPAILVCPGGGYGMVSKREGTPVALEFLANGFVPFILNYSVGMGFCYPQQLTEVAASIDYIRKNEDEFGVDSNRIYLIGFSAGGHLVANIGVEYSNFLSLYDAKPNGVCLCYPVISSDYGFSGGTYDNLLRNYSNDEKEQLKRKLSFNHSDLTNFPPCFVWTTTNDGCVMSQNSISFVSKLVEANVPCEFHMYPDGKHGISTGADLINNNETYLPKVKTWVNLCIDFLKNI